MAHRAELTSRRPWRRFWTKRVGIPLALIVLAVLAVRIGWGVYANGVLADAVAAIRARGEPLTFDDLAPAAIPDDQNAAELYRRAAGPPLLSDGRGVVLSPDPNVPEFERLQAVLWYGVRYPLVRQQRKADVRAAVAAGKESLALCRSARGLSAVDWKVRGDKDVYALVMPQVSPYRALGRMLLLAALKEHESGNDAGAVELLRDALALSRAVDLQASLVSHLAACGIQGLAARTIEQLAPGLQVGDGPRQAKASQVRALIDDLADDRAHVQGRIRASQAERALVHRFFLDVEKDIRDRGNARREFFQLCRLLALRPAHTLDHAAGLRHADAFVQAIKTESWADITGALAALPEYEPGRPSLSSLATGAVQTLSLRPYRIGFRTLAMRRMAVIALAIRLFEVKHGRRPKELKQLVGECLSALPADPYPTGGAAPRYRPENRPPVLYCLGTDGSDDGGLFTLHPAGGLDPEASADLVFFLQGDRPTVPLEALYPKYPPGLGPGGLPSPVAGRLRSPPGR